jgi:hypothetical protein
MDEDRFVSVDDPLSAALMKIKLRAFLNVALDAGGRWGIDFPALDGFTLNVVRKGECWLLVKGHPEEVKLRAGDCFLLTGGKEFTLTNSLSLKKRWKAQELFALGKDGTAVCQGGGDFLVIGTIFRFEVQLPVLGCGSAPSLEFRPQVCCARQQLQRATGSRPSLTLCWPRAFGVKHSLQTPQNLHPAAPAA